MNERCSSEVRAHVGQGGDKQARGSRLRPVRLVEGGRAVCASPPGHVRRGLFAGRFPRTLPEGSRSLASGIPGGSLVAGARPCRPARSLRSCPRPPGPCSRGGRPGRGPGLSSAPPRQPSCQAHLVPAAAVGLRLRFPCELVFLIFHCLPQLIELNL